MVLSGNLVQLVPRRLAGVADAPPRLTMPRS
jgi:hypothetical protein